MLRLTLLSTALFFCPPLLFSADAQDAATGASPPPLAPATTTMTLPMDAPGADETILDDEAMRDSCRATFREIAINPKYDLDEIVVSTNPDYYLICRSKMSKNETTPQLLLLRYTLPGEDPVIVVTVKPQEK